MMKKITGVDALCAAIEEGVKLQGRGRPKRGSTLKKYADFGITRDQAMKWMRLAMIPEEEYERLVTDGATETSLLQRGERWWRGEEEAAARAAQRAEYRYDLRRLNKREHTIFKVLLCLLRREDTRAEVGQVLEDIVRSAIREANAIREAKNVAAHDIFEPNEEKTKACR